MISVDRMRRLGGVSLLALSTVAAASLAFPLGTPAMAQETEIRPPFAAAVPNGAPMSFADLIETVSPAVVTIRASTPPRERETEMSPDLERLPPQLREFFSERFGDNGPAIPRGRESLGSGFFIDAEGHIVTNNHVVAGAEEITVGLSDGSEYEARIVGLDEQTDLALLKVEADVDFPYVTLEEDANYRVGDWVVAVGNPFGLGGTATAGIISAIGRPIGNAAYNDFIQVDAPINRGNSGGPTFDLAGNVIGVNSQIFSPTGGNVGIGFAIPSDVAARIVEQLKSDGRVERGWLGVRIQVVTEDIAGAMALGEARGAIVSSITADSPAAEAGFERDDIILEINGERVEGPRDVTRRVGALSAGETVRFVVLRDGDERTLRVRLGNRPSEDELNNLRDVGEAEAEASYFGMSLVPLTDEDRERYGLAEGTAGLVVGAVDRGSQPSRKGISTGDVILEAGGTPVATPEEFESAVERVREDGRPAVLLLIETRGGQRYFTLEFDQEDE